MFPLNTVTRFAPVEQDNRFECTLECFVHKDYSNAVIVDSALERQLNWPHFI